MRIFVTKNYDQFTRGDNRPVDLARRKRLVASMRLYGWLPSMPLIARKLPSGKLLVKDAQHRLEIARQMGLDVYYVVDPTDFDVAMVNSAATGWTPADYARKHAANGREAYLEGLEFAGRHGLPVGTAFALLAGTTTLGNCQPEFNGGAFQVKDRPFACEVARVYAALTAAAPHLKGSRFLGACMAVCRAKEFRAERLLRNARSCREKLKHYGTRDGYLQALEEVYNFRSSNWFGLRAAAITAMRDRSAAKKSPLPAGPEEE